MKLRKFMHESGIETRMLWNPLHKNLAFRKFKKTSSLVNSETAFNNSICLPSTPSLTKIQQDYVVKEINYFFSNKS